VRSAALTAGVALLGLPTANSAAAQVDLGPPQRVLVELPACPGLDHEALVRLLTAALTDEGIVEVQVRSRAEEGGEGVGIVSIWVPCGGELDTALIRAVVPSRGTQAEQSVALMGLDDEGAAQAVAVAATELLRPTGRRALEAALQAAPPPDPRARADAPATRAPETGAAELDDGDPPGTPEERSDTGIGFFGAAGLELHPSPRTWLYGGELAMTYDRFEIGGAAWFGENGDPLGTVRTRILAVVINAALLTFGDDDLRLELGLGARIGASLVTGDLNDRGLENGFVDPYVLGRVELRGSVAAGEGVRLLARVTVGASRGSTGAARDRDVTTTQGLHLGVGLGLRM
jgi:hypothetical protein